MNFSTKKCPHCDGSGFVLDPVIAGQYHRAMRERKGKSLREVARMMKVTAPYVSDLERGRRNWTDERMEAYRKAVHSK